MNQIDDPTSPFFLSVLPQYFTDLCPFPLMWTSSGFCSELDCVFPGCVHLTYVPQDSRTRRGNTNDNFDPWLSNSDSFVYDPSLCMTTPTPSKSLPPSSYDSDQAFQPSCWGLTPTEIEVAPPINPSLADHQPTQRSESTIVSSMASSTSDPSRHTVLKKQRGRPTKAQQAALPRSSDICPPRSPTPKKRKCSAEDSDDTCSPSAPKIRRISTGNSKGLNFKQEIVCPLPQCQDHLGFTRLADLQRHNNDIHKWDVSDSGTIAKLREETQENRRLWCANYPRCPAIFTRVWSRKRHEKVCRCGPNGINDGQS